MIWITRVKLWLSPTKPKKPIKTMKIKIKKKLSRYSVMRNICLKLYVDWRILRHINDDLFSVTHTMTEK